MWVVADVEYRQPAFARQRVLELMEQCVAQPEAGVHWAERSRVPAFIAEQRCSVSAYWYGWRLKPCYTWKTEMFVTTSMLLGEDYFSNSIDMWVGRKIQMLFDMAS